jgi:branched-chain amino acid transport system substrate-binding protein
MVKILSERKISRRKYLKYAAAGVVVAAGAIGGYAAWQTTKKPLEKDEVIIGVLAPMATRQGSVQRDAAALAIEEINSAGGISGMPVKMAVGDDKLDADTAVAEFRRLVTMENADVITGGYSSGIMTATMEPMAELKTVFLADASSPAHPAKVAEDYEKYKYWFRITQNNGASFAFDLADMIDMLREKGVPVDKVYIIRDEHVWADDVENSFNPLLAERNIEVVKNVKIPRGYTEYEPLIIEAHDLGAQVILPIVALSGTGDVLAKHWATLKLPVLLAGHDLATLDLGFWEKTGGACNYYIFIADGGVVQTAPPTSVCANFIENYTKKYEYPPEAHQGYGAYDAVYLYKMAVEEAAKAGAPDPFDSNIIVEYLEKLATLENPVELTRNIAFYPPGDENKWDHDLAWGDKYVRNLISEWIDGKWYQIWPKDKANAELKLPPWFK